MLTSPCPTTDDPPPMPPKSDQEYASTSFTGVPSQAVKAAHELADRRGVHLRDVYQAALRSLITRVRAGETIDWPHTRPGTGGTPYHTRLEVGVLEDMRAACDELQVRKVVFFLAAVRDHLHPEGFDTGIDGGRRCSS